MPQTVITNVGMNAAVAVMESGFKIKVATFKLGSAYGYTPAATDTALHGSTVYTAAVTEIIQTGDKEVTFKVVLGSNIGPFQFGEIGLYLASGQLFALVALENLHSKQATTSSDKGDTFRINIPVMLNNLAANIEFTSVSVVQTELAEIASVNVLPEANSAPANTYLITNTHAKRRTVAVSAAMDNKWYFLDYNPLVTGVVTASAPGSVTFTFNGNLPNLTQVGDYILQGAASSTVSQSVLALTMRVNSDTSYTFTYDTSVVGFNIGATVQVWIHNAVVSGLMYQYYAVKDWTAGAWSYGNFVLRNKGLYLAAANNIQTGDEPGVSTKWLPIMDFTSPLAAARLTGIIADARIPSNIVRTTRRVDTAGGLLTGGGALDANLTLRVDAATTQQAIAGTSQNTVMTPATSKEAIHNALSNVSVTGGGLATGGGALSTNRVIRVPVASIADAKGGTDNDSAMTPLTTMAAIEYKLSTLQLDVGGLITGGGRIDGDWSLTVHAATNAEAWAGVITSAVITPANLSYVLDRKLASVSIETEGMARGGGSLSASRSINVPASKVANVTGWVTAQMNSGVITPYTARMTAHKAINELTLVRGMPGSKGISVTKDVTGTTAYTFDGDALSLDKLAYSIELTPGSAPRSLADLGVGAMGLLVKVADNKVVTRKFVQPDVKVDTQGRPISGPGVKIAPSSSDDGSTGHFTLHADDSVVRTFGKQDIAGSKHFYAPTGTDPVRGGMAPTVRMLSVGSGVKTFEIYRNWNAAGSTAQGDGVQALTCSIEGAGENMIESESPFFSGESPPSTFTIRVTEKAGDTTPKRRADFAFRINRTDNKGELVAPFFTGNGSRLTNIDVNALVGVINSVNIPWSDYDTAIAGTDLTKVMSPRRVRDLIMAMRPTDDQAKAGGNNGTLMTPRAANLLLNERFTPLLLSKFGQHLSANGWTQLPNGVILQWGVLGATSVESGAAGAQVTFPIAFPHRCGAPMVFDWIGDGNDINAHHIGGFDIQPTGFKVIVTKADGSTYANSHVYWFAIGY